jgi:tRNA A37 methylthiotransferase MiaB
MKQLPSNIKKERSKILTELYINTALKQNKKWLGWKGMIIIDEVGKDNTWVGRNFAYKPVIIKGNFNFGDEVNVKIKDASAYDLKADVLNKSEIEVATGKNSI